MSDILRLGWLPVSYNKDLNLSKIVCKAIHSEDWPSYLRLEVRAAKRLLHSSDEINLAVPPTSGTLQDCAAKRFNNLPRDVKQCTDTAEFIRKCRTYYFSRAKADLNAT